MIKNMKLKVTIALLVILFSVSLVAINSNGTVTNCSNCGTAMKKEVTLVPGCETEGVRTYTCSNCSNAFTETIPAMGHYYEGEITKQPTCEEEGITTYTCSNCGDAYTETMAALGHNYQETAREEATCDKDGYVEYTCTRCGDKKTEKIPATGHNYVNGECINCGKKDETITDGPNDNDNNNDNNDNSNSNVDDTLSKDDKFPYTRVNYIFSVLASVFAASAVAFTIIIKKKRA